MIAFADTCYWVALVDPQDDLHERAMQVARNFEGRPLVTTDFVLIELLNFFSGYGPHLHRAAHAMVSELLVRAQVKVIHASRDDFKDGCGLYCNRPDKGYSHTDCVSFLVMRRLKIDEALTNDHHFVQEGFRALL